ncbi:unnamed protein product [Rhizoctonia solani]|uniref:Transmembrane protein n=1 Tax=Rhizoctonia solani TaxID=456999 RepID=A0A8H3AX32_9AGAM|nr:unnamed protein product [Rhizoctonia solani]
MQSIVQGILIPMLATFMTTKSNHRPWFKIYVFFVNILALVQTIIHIIQAFDIINAFGDRLLLVAAAPVLTGFIGASVQAFFAYRCWRIYHQRILPMIPFLLLWLVSFVSAIVMGAFLARPIGHRPDNAAPQIFISTIWVISSLLFDLITTSSTIAYLYRVRTDLNANRNTLLVVWNVIWASAAPPFVLIVIALIDGYVVANAPGVVGVISVAMSAKFFALSLMINLVGQGYIRRQFEPSYPSPPGNPQSSRSQTGNASELVTGGLTAHTNDIELLTRISPEVAGVRDDGSGTYHSDNVSIKNPSIVKQEEGDRGYTTHNIELLRS